MQPRALTPAELDVLLIVVETMALDGASQDALLSGLDEGVVARLPRAHSPVERLRGALRRLNTMDSAPGAARRPLAVWLEGAVLNARASGGPFKALDRFLHIVRGPVPKHSRDGDGFDLSRVARYAAAPFIARTQPLERLDAAADAVGSHAADRPRVVCLVGRGGVGKTALVAHWLKQRTQHGFGAFEAAFAWSFSGQGSPARQAAPTAVFLRAALAHFSLENANSVGHPIALAKRLAHHLQTRRVLLILDGLDLGQPPTDAESTPGSVTDRAMSILLRALNARFAGLCVVTARQPLPEIATRVDLDHLPTNAGVALLTRLGVTGSSAALATVVDAVGGHPLTLAILGRFLAAAHQGDVDAYSLPSAGEASVADVLDRVHAWLSAGKTADRRALALLMLMGLFDRPAPLTLIDALLAAPAVRGLTDPLSGLDAPALTRQRDRLRALGLLTLERVDGRVVSQDVHPSVRAWCAERLYATSPAAFRAGHGHLFDWYCAAAPHQPDTVEDMQPLFAAMRHGCLAARDEEVLNAVYVPRIQRGSLDYSTDSLGLIAENLDAIAHLFAQRWVTPSFSLSDRDRTWVISTASYLLRAVGRLDAALTPMQRALGDHIKVRDWVNASTLAGNLSETYALLGQLDQARELGEAAVAHAERSGDPVRTLAASTVLADALFKAGEPAAARFEAAETLHETFHPPGVTLYSVQGYRYCAVLVGPAERAAWRRVLGLPAGDSSAACQAVRVRAEAALRIAERKAWLLDAALDRLTLGRAALFEPIDVAVAAKVLRVAVAGLRSAGAQHFLPPALLTRALCRALAGRHVGVDSAEDDLNEAWSLANASRMPLCLADVHLHRARLFHRVAPYPWRDPIDDLAAARALIHTHGYRQRLAELADAEGVILKADGSRAMRTDA